MHEQFFICSSKDDENMIQCAAEDLLTKKTLGARLNYKETGIIICWYVIEQARMGKDIRQIIDSSRKLLTADDVMFGVPEILQKVIVNVEFKDGKRREVVVENPVEPEEVRDLV
jgi:urease gamma subunit